MTLQGWLPEGLHRLAAEHGSAIDASVGCDIVGCVDRWVDMPHRVVEQPTLPAAPLDWGAGALSVDLGPDDAATWDTFRELVATDTDPESVARRAQVWRLAVTPYRCRPVLGARSETVPETPGVVDLRGVRVVDMTSMWAGPLATELLARAGASVVKIEPAARPDGLRYGDGDDGSGNAPMFRELNANKEIADLDLRHCCDRSEFEQLLRRADIVVTSMSHRAVCNLGVDATSVAERHPGLRTLTITAFDRSSPEADWVAYGSGVHAASGLGWVEGSPRAPAFSYPDPVAGLLACRVALAQLAGVLPRHASVSLAGSIQPLVSG